MQVVTIDRATHELGITKNLTRSPVFVPSERDEGSRSAEKVPAPSEKGLLTDICDTPKSRRKCRPRQLFKTEEIRFVKIAYPLFSEKINFSIDSDSSEKNIYNYSDMNKEDNRSMLSNINNFPSNEIDNNENQNFEFKTDISDSKCESTYVNGIEFYDCSNEIVFCDDNIHEDKNEDDDSVKDPLDISLHNEYKEVS